MLVIPFKTKEFILVHKFYRGKNFFWGMGLRGTSSIEIDESIKNRILTSHSGAKQGRDKERNITQRKSEKKRKYKGRKKAKRKSEENKNRVVEKEREVYMDSEKVIKTSRSRKGKQ